MRVPQQRLRPVSHGFWRMVLADAWDPHTGLWWNLWARQPQIADRRHEAHVSKPNMEEKDLRERIHTFLVARLRIILAAGLLVTCSCDGNGRRMTAHDAGVAGSALRAR
jgi:hypothetical protein